MSEEKRGKTQKFFLTEEIKEELIKYARAGLINDQICKLIGICDKTLWNKLKEDPEFEREFKNAKQLADVEVENSLYKGAVGYTIKQQEAKVVLDGKDSGSHVEIVEVERHIPGEFNKQRLWLMNRNPDKWKDKQELSVDVTKLSDEELEKLAKKYLLGGGDE